MKTLDNILTSENTGFHFNEPADGTNIAAWVRDNLDKFNLNKPQSCKVTHFMGDITISGDEDIVLLRVNKLKTITLENSSYIIQRIILKKHKGIDCTEEESSEIKTFLKENVAFIEMDENEVFASEGFQVKDIVSLFPCETSEVIEEMSL